MQPQLRLPLSQIQVNQPFGANYLNFYQQWGMKGHNGIDFRAMDGFNCYAATSGTVTVAGTQSDGGIEIEIWDKVQWIKTIYYHLKDVCVKVGDNVQAGQLIAHCDNTGKYTTGNHLHFGLKFVNFDGNTLNKENGYAGAVDPTPYFTMAFDGTPIKNSDCYKSNSYHRYFRKDGRNMAIEIKILAVLAKYFKRLPSPDEINAAVYGAWDRESIANPAMRDNWAFITKGELLSGKKPFQTICK